MNKALLPADLIPAQVKATIGLISDTHMPQRCAALPATLADVFQDVDLILHAGDVGELWVLDQLSAYAPVIAVHGNDDTVAAQRELPYQQVITVAGQRILLWHSHFSDRVDEMDSRRDDDLPPKFVRSLERAHRCGAQTVVFGHWHMPLLYEKQGIRVINPGALASGNPITRQLRQTVALLFVCGDGTTAVSHIDLAAPNVIYQPPVDLSLGFNAISQEFSASIVAPELAARHPQLLQQLYKLGPEITWPVLLRVAHRCWAGEQEAITLADLLAEVRNDPDLGPRRKSQYEALLQQLA